ncbi:lysoplasmalogenase family protein [Clostridium sp. Cult3]|uniref:lysoplasmalogenase family protein n=1 Tax=Clostridium sp. Cult3 TaxID=2079004 RepID=UPI001F2BA1C8|nr:lysoplasmalogenase family protein [Clostridium sp. Cult3]MCF6461313.1 hypothetical protein [Clostridium sp. Cult3]
MSKAIQKRRIIGILLLFIVILYIWFMYMDIFDIHGFISTDRLKFLSMIIVFIISLFTRKDALSYKDLHLLQVGLFITLIADLFLLILDSHYILGIFLFSIVQIIYSFRYELRNLKLAIRNFIVIFLSLSIVYFIVNKLVIELDFIWIMGIFYAFCLLNSVAKAFKAYRYKIYPKPNRHMVLIGMILFLLCDISVAMYNIFSEGLLYSISSIAMWLFYLPSQVLLALSGYNYE